MRKTKTKEAWKGIRKQSSMNKNMTRSQKITKNINYGGRNDYTNNDGLAHNL